jgi:uncharacterized protein (TIGR04255 family)
MGAEYTRPPVIEAVIEFQFAAPIGAREQERLRDKLKKFYPAIELQTEYQVAITPAGAHTTPGQIGYKLTAANASDICIIRRNSLACSQLAPYTGWDTINSNARRNLDIADKILSRPTISRIGVRYVNRIDVPLEQIAGKDVSVYLKTGVALPEGLAGAMRAYSVSVDFDDALSGTRTVVNSGIAPPALIDHISIMLDIDVSLQQDIPVKRDDAWQAIEDLRSVKNRVFESLITDATRDLFR